MKISVHDLAHSKGVPAAVREGMLALQSQLIAALDQTSHDTRREWVGLTDDEQQQAYEQWQNEGWGVFYKAIEAKLKEKNA